MSVSTKVNTINCDECGDVVFSRAPHDFRQCSCKSVAIDGGFNYTRYIYKDIDKCTMSSITIGQTPMELYNDWAKGTNRFGVIHKRQNKKD